ncbi:MAG: hypothetical protein WCP31_12500 [Chloroflexales bacterium]
MNVPYTQLQQSWQHLSQQWQTTTPLWDDQVRWAFEAEFWQPLRSQVPMTLMKMEQLVRVITQAKQQVK